MKQLGLTTRQMLAAPTGALFVWGLHPTLSYANALAAHLGRQDLVVVSPGIFDDGGRRLMGRKVSAIVLDHACQLTNRQMDVCWEIKDRIEQRGKAA